MANANTSSMAAVLSLIVSIIFWFAIIIGVAGTILFVVGLLGSLNGGTVTLPGVQAVAEGVPMGRFVVVLVGLVIFATGIAYVCSILRRILVTLAKGDPFVPENAARMTKIAIAIGAIEVIRNCTIFIINATLDLGGGYRGVMSFNLAAWGAVIVLLILAQVFKEGSRLREEEQMTI
jgi:hypothetical protein